MNDEEHQQQAALFQWARVEKANHPELTLLFAIPNGGKRGKATAARLKMEGVQPGVPDLFLPVARYPHHGFFLELKATNGKLSAYQRTWIAALRDYSYWAGVYFGWEQAARAILAYLALPTWRDK